LENLEPLLKACGNVLEVSIGHAFTAEALQFGFAETVRRYNELLDKIAAE
ncbi:MAG: pyridoxine 5'-phosphate synthase, partial [Sutterella sp.]|nr:pyridoxine 5'-phosphate synthase [Sutterella sp.]